MIQKPAMDLSYRRLYSISGFVARNTLVSMGTHVTATLLSAVLGVFLARTLGVTAYGEFAVAYTVLLIAVIPAKFGMDTSAMKLIASYEATEDLSRLHGVLRFAALSTIRSSLLVTIFSLATLVGLSDVVRGTSLMVLLSAVAGLAPLSLLHVYQYILYGLRRYVLAQLYDYIIRPISLIALILITKSANIPISASLVMLMNVLITTTLCVWAARTLNQTLPTKTFSAPPMTEPKEWSKTRFSMFQISALNAVVAHTDILLVALFCTPRDAGYYAAASRLAALILFFFSSVNAIAAPQISRAFAAGDSGQIALLTRVCGRTIAGVTILLTLVTLILDTELLSLFGDEFTGAAQILTVLVLAQMVKSLSGVGGFLLTMTKHETLSARLSLWSAAINFALGISLASSFGAIGAAWATLATNVTWTLSVVILVYRRLGLRSLG